MTAFFLFLAWKSSKWDLNWRSGTWGKCTTGEDRIETVRVKRDRRGPYFVLCEPNLCQLSPCEDKTPITAHPWPVKQRPHTVLCMCQESKGVWLFARVETLRQVLKVIVWTAVMQVSGKIQDRYGRNLETMLASLPGLGTWQLCSQLSHCSSDPFCNLYFLSSVSCNW